MELTFDILLSYRILTDIEASAHGSCITLSDGCTGRSLSLSRPYPDPFAAEMVR